MNYPYSAKRFLRRAGTRTEPARSRLDAPGPRGKPRAIRRLAGVTPGIATALVTVAGLALSSAARADEKETLIPPLKFGDESFVSVYGQINKGFLVYDDGGGTLLYPLVDNDNSSTRFGFRAGAPIEGDFRFEGNFEFSWTPYSTNTVNRSNRKDPDFSKETTTLLRKFEGWVESPTYGKLSVGQGSMASDGTAEVDLSGTSVVSYSLVADMAGGQFLRNDGDSSSTQVKSTFGNLDGLSRLMRVRYDTPSFAGFSAAASLGTTVVRDVLNDENWDFALRYGGELGEFKVEGAAAYSRADDKDQDRFDGSVSVRHATGWNGTIAGGTESSGKSSADPDFLYGKLGYATQFFDVGETAFSVDYYRGQDFSTDNSDSQSFGAAVVQRLDYLKTELYVGFRLYDYSEPGDNYEDGWGVLTGFRAKF